MKHLALLKVIILFLFLTNLKIFSYEEGDAILWCGGITACTELWTYQQRSYTVETSGPPDFYSCDVTIDMFYRYCPPPVSEFQMVIAAIYYNNDCNLMGESHADLFQDCCEALLRDNILNPSHCIVRLQTPACWLFDDTVSSNGYNAHFCQKPSCCWIVYNICYPYSRTIPQIIERGSYPATVDCSTSISGCEYMCNNFPSLKAHRKIDPYNRKTLGSDSKTDFSIEYSIVPNPVTDNTEVNYKSPEKGFSKISLYNVNGEIVFSQEQYKSGIQDSYTLNLKELSDGIYHFIIKINDNQIISDNFIINK